MKKTGSQISKIQKAHSVVNTDITENLLASSFETIFTQLRRYTELLSGYDPIDWKTFVKKRNYLRSIGSSLPQEDPIELADEKTNEQKEEEKKEEEKWFEDLEERREEAKNNNYGIPDIIEEINTRNGEKEVKKIQKMFDHKVISKMIRLLEVFTSIALKNDQIHEFVLKVTQPVQLSILWKLLLTDNFLHGIAIMKIINNLMKIGIELSIFDEAIHFLKDFSVAKELLNLKPKTSFEGSIFLQFLFNYLLSIRSCQWAKRDFESSGAYNISCGIVRLFQTILRTDSQKVWKERIEVIMDDFVDNMDDYPFEEFDILMSFFDGGEFKGFNVGGYGITKDKNEFTTVGFVKRWYGINPPDSTEQYYDFQIFNVSSEIRNKDDCLLAIYYDKDHPERNDMFLAIPEEVNLISDLEHKTHDYLLNKERLNKFLNAMDVDDMPDKTDPVSLTKRCIGMKILVNQIENNGEKFSEFLDESFKNKLLKFLLKECSLPESDNEVLRCEWYDQKIFAIKKYAAEHQISLKKEKQNNICFSGNQMGITKVLTDSNKEQYTKCLPLLSAMNYGKVMQKSQYSLINGDSIMTEKLKEDNIVILDSDKCDTPEKLSDIFKHTNVIITSDLDLKKLHDEIAKVNRDIAYFKTIVLLEKEDYDELKLILSEDPKVKKGSTDDMELHQTFVSELTTFCKFEKEELDKLFEGKEHETFSAKLSILNDWIKENSKDKEEVKEESKEEAKEESKEETKEESKEDPKEETKEEPKEETKEEIIGQAKEEDKAEDEPKIEEDSPENNPLTTFGLENVGDFSTNLNELCNYGDSSYNTQTTSKTNREELQSKVYSVNERNIINDYLTTLATLYKQLCRKTITSFFNQMPLESIFEIVLTEKESYDQFLKYMMIIANEAVKSKINSNNDVAYTEFLAMTKKMIEISIKDSKYKEIAETYFKKLVLKGTCDTVKNSLKDKKKMVLDAFKSEVEAINGLNTHLIPDIIKIFLEICPKLIYDNDKDLVKLITSLMLVAITFRKEKDLHKSIYLVIHKLILPIAKYPDKYSRELKEDLLSIKLFKLMVEKVPFDISASSYSVLTNEQKLMFELLLLFRRIDLNLDNFASVYPYNDKLIDVERSITVLKELTKFDFASYMIYYEKELTEEQRNTKTYIETYHNMLNGKISAKFAYEGFKKMGFKVETDSRIDTFASIGITSDEEGKNMIKKITQKEITDQNTWMNIYSNTFFLHYPYKPPKIVSFGEGYDYKLGNNNSCTTSEPSEIQDYNKDMKQLQNMSNWTVILGTDNQIYYTGYKSSFSNYHYTMKKYEKKMPEDTVIQIESGRYNFACLTDTGKIYLDGYDYGYHIHNNCEKYELYHKKRPNEDTEKVTGLSMGYNYHIYVTDNGKCYGAGNEFMQGIGKECTNENYIEIEFEEGVTPLKPYCCNVSDTYRPCLMKVRANDRIEWWTAGHNSRGLLGQGDSVSESRTFKCMDYDKEKVNFVEVSLKFNFGMAVTDKGELYGWGNNEYKSLGMADTKNYWSPTEIPFFKDYYVHDFDCGEYHAIVWASKRTEMDKRMVFAIGNIYGINQDAKNEDGILHLKQYDGLEIKLICAGERCTFLAFDGEKTAAENSRVHEGYTCDVTKESPINGTLHFFKDKDKKWHFLSQKGYEEMKDSLPGICYATKFPIENIPEKEWPELKEDELLDLDKDA
jgi:alpha-tubulin suppressor-like RCC1 family protein